MNYRVCRLILPALAFLPFTCLATPAEVRVEISKYGEITVAETANGGSTTEESLFNLAYALGVAQYNGQPLTMLANSLTATDHGSTLNQAILEEIINGNSPRYSKVFFAIPSIPRKVDSDGTVEEEVSGDRKLEDISTYARWWGLDAWVDSELESMDPQVLRLFTQWVKGAQFQARQTEAAFYAANPELQPTNIVQYFYERTPRDFLIAYALYAQFHDLGTVSALAAAFGDDLVHNELGHPLPPLLETVSLSEQSPLVQFQEHFDTPIGASNGAAGTYRDISDPSKLKCFSTGEPHQMSSFDTNFGAGQKMNVSRGWVSDGANGYKPFVLGVYGTNPGFIGLQNTAGNSTTGTAGPTASAFTFYVETDGVNYKYQDVWYPLESRPLDVIRNGVTETITEYYVPGFGKVFLLVKFSGKYFAITIRQKSPSSFVDGMWRRFLAGLHEDGDEYLQVLEKAIPHYGEAGCHSAPSRSPEDVERLAYFSLNQGWVDEVAGSDTIDGLTVNPPVPQYLKTGVRPTSYCAEQRHAAADNGALSGGCEVPPSVPSHMDPGRQTHRQLQLKTFELAHRDTPMNKQDVFHFASGTHGGRLKKLLEIIVASFDKFGATVVPSGEIPIVSIAVELLRVHEGDMRDSLEQILILYLQPQMENILRGTLPTPATVRNFLLYTDRASRTEMQNALDLPSAAFLLEQLRKGITFLTDKCVARGITTYSQVLRMVNNGVVVAEDFSGPGAGSRSSAWVVLQPDGMGGFLCEARTFSVSPLKLISFDDEVFYLPYGPPISPFALYPGLYDQANIEWGTYWRKHNRAGLGYSEMDAYRRFSLAPISQIPAVDSDTVLSFTVVVPEDGATPTSSPTPSSTPSSTPNPTPSEIPTQEPGPSPTANPPSGSDTEVFKKSLSELQALVQAVRPLPPREKRKARKRQRVLRKETQQALLLFRTSADSFSETIEATTASEFQSLVQTTTKRVKSLLKARGKKFVTLKRFIKSRLNSLGGY
ncbi:MAG: hypothetical protein KDD70_00065 [Bdellovibrionales bacterium]|nr:hypothetical protein [Bdellovibrionales bacterium]